MFRIRVIKTHLLKQLYIRKVVNNLLNHGKLAGSLGLPIIKVEAFS